MKDIVDRRKLNTRLTAIAGMCDAAVDLVDLADRCHSDRTCAELVKQSLIQFKWAHSFAGGLLHDYEHVLKNGD